ncbi:MAG: aminomethyl-transferring glycine dehydrogenase subunit GcvPA [Planctomycetes bacterium]|nr:aminomethyl-transferring glycine dehydrogenase subunit GcvPA [Planctomycetota bacterium]
MPYIQNTPHDVAEMLRVIGKPSIDALFETIPSRLRLQGLLDVPAALPEASLLPHLQSLAGKNRTVDAGPCFLGGGAYVHFIPAAVDALVSRGEILTAYTPYQPEVSQGSLQIFYEYQTLMCELTGLDVSNASHYDGASALAEAVLMSMDVTDRPAVVVPATLHPEYLQVLRTYVAGLDARVEVVPATGYGPTDLDAMQKRIGSETAAVVIAQPNFYGGIEDLRRTASIAHGAGALAVACVNPIACMLLETPGEAGFDIAVGEGQPLGCEVSYGGPWFGFVTARETFVRKMPGRIVGEARDHDGRRGYVLTLQTREQHIRRAKATSNICTNQGLLATRATIHMALLGRAGLYEVATQCVQKAHFLADEVAKVPGYRVLSPGPFFHEFVVETPIPARELNARLLREGILGGVDLGKYWPDAPNRWLLCATELTTRAHVEALTTALGR